MAWLNSISLEWLALMWRGIWQGTLLAALVWGICKALPRTPVSTRYWLWWIVCLKFLLGAVVSPFIPLTLLPATQSPPFYRVTASVTDALSSRGTSIKVNHFQTGNEPVTLPEHPAELPVLSQPTVVPNAHYKSQSALLEIPAALFLVWLTLAGILAATSLLHTVSLSKIVRRSRPIGSTLNDLLPSLQLLGLPVRRSSEIDGVCLVGIVSPVILVPEQWIADTPPSEVAMAIAHEVAHYRRLDLLFGIIPSLAATVFFFLPPARIAARHCCQYREEACDTAAILATRCTRIAYAQMLVKCAKPNPTTIGALAVSPAFRQLQGRLIGLERSSRQAPQADRAMAALFTAVVLLLIAPWHLMARAARTLPQKLKNALHYQIIDLGAISGDDTNQFQINDVGQVLGTSGGQPFLWDGNRVVQVGRHGYRLGRGGGLNNSGDFVITYYSDWGNPHAFFSSSSLHALKGLRRFQYTVARSINSSGWIAGSAQHSGSDQIGAEIVRAVVIMDNHAHDLGTLGGQHSAAYCVNELGQVVGKADLSPTIEGSHPTHAFLWQSGAMKDLGTLGGANSLAYSVNNDGTVAGFSLLPGDTVRHACVWTSSPSGAQESVDLGTLPGDRVSEAHGINDQGIVVGTSDSGPNAAANKAILWQGEHTVDLNRVAETHGSWQLQDAMSINNHGEIVGKGLLSGKQHAFILVPTAR